MTSKIDRLERELSEERRIRDDQRNIIALVRIGAKYERADQKRDFDTLIMLDKEILFWHEKLSETWIAPFIVRGRNNIRRARGQEEIHV